MEESAVQTITAHFNNLERGGFKVQAAFPGRGLEEVDVDGKQRSTIQECDIASKWDGSKHVVVWTDDNAGRTESQFVNAIRPGDRIAVTVKAQVSLR